MPLELYPIQYPTTPKGSAQAPLLLLLDGSGIAIEYASLLPLDRLVYGVCIAVPKFHTARPDEKHSRTIQREYEEYLTREFSTIDDYMVQLIRVIGEEVRCP